jgi:hypothetical protein
MIELRRGEWLKTSGEVVLIYVDKLTLEAEQPEVTFEIGDSGRAATIGLFGEEFFHSRFKSDRRRTNLPQRLFGQHPFCFGARLGQGNDRVFADRPPGVIELQDETFRSTLRDSAAKAAKFRIPVVGGARRRGFNRPNSGV